jgi:hypothetical protein
MLPGPATLKFQLQRHAEKGADEDDQAENDHVVEGGIYYNSANDVASYKELEPLAEWRVPYPGGTGEREYWPLHAFEKEIELLRWAHR